MELPRSPCPYFTGSVVVGSSENYPNKDFLSECAKNEEGVACWDEILKQVLFTKGVSEMFYEAQEFYKDISGFSNRCHYLMHNIGIAAYGLFLEDRFSILSEGIQFCGNGFLHGFMEAYIGDTGDPEAAGEICRFIGNNLVGIAQDANLSCHHGIGHGAIEVAIGRGISQEDEMVKTSLGFCEKSSTNQNELYRCATGVFNFVSVLYTEAIQENEHYFTDEEIFSICHKQKERHKQACYDQLNVLLMYINGTDFKNTLYSILDNVEDRYQKSAISHVAPNLTLNKRNEDKNTVNSAIMACRELRKELRDRCFIGIIGLFLEHGGGDGYKDGIEFCSNDVLRQDEKDTCFSGMAYEVYFWYSKNKGDEICYGLEEKYHQYCEI